MVVTGFKKKIAEHSGNYQLLGKDEYRRFCNFNSSFEKCYPRCIKIYNSLLQFSYTQTSIIFNKRTPQEPDTTHLKSVETITWRTNFLRPTSIITITFTSKSRKWFSKLHLQISVRNDMMRLWDTIYCASRQTEQCPTHRLMCVYLPHIYSVFW